MIEFTKHKLDDIYGSFGCSDDPLKECIEHEIDAENIIDKVIESK